MSIFNIALDALLGSAPEPIDWDAKRVADEARAERFRGWHPWPIGPQPASTPTPYSHERVSIMRDGWEAPVIASPRSMDPMMNVVGLYWKPLPGTNHPQ